MKRASDLPNLDKEVILSAASLSNAEIRFLVSDYYASQEFRKRTDMQLRHLPNAPLGNRETLLQFTSDSFARIELKMTKALAVYAEGSAIGRWCLAQHGMGPVLTAGLLAHIDIKKAPTVGHIWSFAGLNPNMVWNKGEKRPYNAELKQLTYHMGECFKRSSNHPDSFYGKIYRRQKVLVVQRNDEGKNAERAKTFRTQSAEVRKTLAKGKLPDNNLDRQAGNFAAKIFLSHLHGVMYWDHFGMAPPKPFGIAILGHAHEIKIPNLEMFPGLEQAYYGPVDHSLVGRQRKAERLERKAEAEASERTVKPKRKRA